MRKKLIVLLLSGILGIIPIGSAFAEELSSGDEVTAVLDESANPEDVLSAGEAEEVLLDSGDELPAAGATYSGTWGTCQWDIDSNGVLTIHAGTGESRDANASASVWENYKNDIYSVVAEQGVIFPECTLNLFDDLHNCRSMDLSLADTSDVKDIRGMFSRCMNLTSLDLSSFDTSNVTNMNWMFSGCNSIPGLDLSSFDTSNVTGMDGMFAYCTSLIHLDLSSFDTSDVTNMSGMFARCGNLTSLNLSNFDTSSVQNMEDMFFNCDQLSEIVLGSGFSFKGNGSTAAYLPDKTWYSITTGKAYTAAEITETRNNIADTYSTIKPLILQQPKLIAAYNGAKGIGLKFHKADNATEYVLYRKFEGVWSRICTFSAADPGLQIDGNKIMYTDTSVAQNYGKGYIYSVAAKNGDQETTYDTKGSAIYRLTPPTLTGATNSSAGTATVSWKGVFGRTETNGTYDLQYAEYKDGKTGTFKSVTTLPGYNNLTLKTTVSGLTKGTRYVFRIRCAKTNKDRGTYYSEYSKWLSVTITK